MHSTRTARLCVGTLLAALSMGSITKAFSQAGAAAPEQRRVINSVETMFRSLDTNDQALLTSVTEPGFYLFDAGARFEPSSLLALLAQMKASGKHFRWHVTEADVNVQGSTAWIAYINRGSMTDSNGTTDMVWLESAFLVKHGDHWKLAFLQSTPAAKAADSAGR